MQIQQLESERDEAKQKLAVTERRAEVAAKAAERNHASLRRDCQKLESSNANLMQRCRYIYGALRLSVYHWNITNCSDLQNTSSFR